MKEVRLENFQYIEKLALQADHLVLSRAWMFNFGMKGFKKANYKKAIKLYQQALKLVPAPKKKWAVSQWLLISIAEACYFSGDFKKAKTCLDRVFLWFPNTKTHPAISLRYAQVCFKVGKEKDAKRYVKEWGIDTAEFKKPIYWELQTGLTIRTIESTDREFFWFAFPKKQRTLSFVEMYKFTKPKN